LSILRLCSRVINKYPAINIPNNIVSIYFKFSSITEA
jgi:hypothetical protein